MLKTIPDRSIRLWTTVTQVPGVVKLDVPGASGIGGRLPGIWILHIAIATPLFLLAMSGAFSPASAWLTIVGTFFPVPFLIAAQWLRFFRRELVCITEDEVSIRKLGWRQHNASIPTREIDATFRVAKPPGLRTEHVTHPCGVVLRSSDRQIGFGAHLPGLEQDYLCHFLETLIAEIQQAPAGSWTVEIPDSDLERLMAHSAPAAIF